MEEEILGELDRKKIKNKCFVCGERIERKPPDRLAYYMKYGNICLPCNSRVNDKITAKKKQQNPVATFVKRMTW
jgi:hypothetical protein